MSRRGVQIIGGAAVAGIGYCKLAIREKPAVSCDSQRHQWELASTSGTR
jgi:hypothetical protein